MSCDYKVHSIYSCAMEDNYIRLEYWNLPDNHVLVKSIKEGSSPMETLARGGCGVWQVCKRAEAAWGSSPSSDWESGHLRSSGHSPKNMDNCSILCTAQHWVALRTK